MDANAKDPAVLETLERLRTTSGGGAFDLVDHWDADRTAVGIARADDHRMLVYFATYGSWYYAELELPPPPRATCLTVSLGGARA